MSPHEAKALLLQGAGAQEPIVLPSSVLSQISLSDVPEGVQIEVGRTENGSLHIEWGGTISKLSGRFIGEADYTRTRKYLYNPLGLEQYLDFVRRAVEVRRKVIGDVHLTFNDDYSQCISLTFTVDTNANNIGDAYRHILAVCDELNEPAEQAASEIGKKIAEVAARISGWGSEAPDVLVNVVQKAKIADERGRSLEELMSKLLQTVPGFTVTERVKTATEEIDITVLNNSDDPRFRRESALILAECKNWSEKCGKDEFVIFKEKLENRSKRCTLGLLVSWNGFASTVTKEMLRGSREEFLIIPITGKEIRAAVRDKNFPDVLAACWNNAVHL